MTIVKIHGTSGSGKTTAVRELIAKSILEPTEWSWYYMEGKRTVEAVIMELTIPEVTHRVYVLGQYSNTCGGVDTISDVNQIGLMIDKLHLGDAHVVYEGLLTSTYYGWLGQHSLKYKDEYIYAFLDTPLETCIERVKQRRLAAGNTKPFNVEPTTEKFKSAIRVMNKLPAKGHRVEVLDHKKPMADQLIHLLG